MIKKIFKQGLSLSKSKTAKSLYWVFSGNFITIILTFFTTIVIANNISIAENGIFLALLTLANLLSDFGEAGLGSTLSNFIPPLIAKKSFQDATGYIATAFRLELWIALIISLITIILSQQISILLFDRTPLINVILTALILFILILFGYSNFALSAYKKFQEVALINIFYSLVRLGILVVLIFFVKLSIPLVLITYLIAWILGWFYSLLFLETKFIHQNPSIEKAKKLISFSLFLALQKLFISISSRLDLLMIIPFAGATAAGIYGIGSRFALVYPLIISSLGQVLAPTFADYTKGKDALKFLSKVGLVILLLLLSQLLFYIFAHPLITTLTPKYEASVNVFKGLLIAMIGFVIATPFVSFLIYTLKKPYITTISSAIQLIIIFISNLYFIPMYHELGPIIGIGIGNVVICIIAIGASIFYLYQEVRI